MVRPKKIRRLIYVTKGDERVVSVLLRDPYIIIQHTIACNELPEFVMEANISEELAQELFNAIYLSGRNKPCINDLSRAYLVGYIVKDVAVSSISINRYTPLSRFIKIEGLYLGTEV